MSDTVIKVENLSKRYRIGHQEEGPDTLAGVMTSWMKSPLRNFRRLRSLTTFGKNGESDEAEDIIWAVNDVSFQVKHGEVLGIVGRNGAGKSTLLKILSRITEPTSGRVEIHGRVSSLLEVGTGFHPELTGRENIYLNGTILGMKKREIDGKLDEIIDFSGVEKFLDTPVKRYSSGMKVRLAFAVAAHLEPEILVTDEVLAVGDAAFQKKCIAKMGDVADRQGRTVLFVSHNMQAIRSLCSRALLLENGSIIREGDTREIVNHYLSATSGPSCITSWSTDTAPGNHELKLRSVCVHDSFGNTNGIFFSSKNIYVDFEFECFSTGIPLNFGFDLTTPEGDLILRSYQTDMSEHNWPPLKAGRNCWRCELPANLFNYGSYQICPRILKANEYHIIESAPMANFDIVLDHGVSPYWARLQSKAQKPGFIGPILNWTIPSDPSNSNNSEMSSEVFP